MPFDPGTAAQGAATGSLSGLANLAYTIVMSSKTDVHFEASKAGAFTTIPEGAHCTKVERVEWHGLWYTHVRLFGLLPKSLRSLVKRREVEDNLDAQKLDAHGRLTGKLELGVTGLFLPLVVSYDLYRIDTQPTTAALGARKAELTSRLVTARKDLIDAQVRSEEAKYYNHQRQGDMDVLQVNLDASLRKLKGEVDRLEQELKEVRGGIFDTEDVRRGQTTAGTVFMHNFKIVPTNNYLGQELDIPRGVVGRGKIEMSAEADHYNPFFQITFHWREQFLGLDSYPPYSETFKWYADAGPQGDGKFVTRFTTGARRMTTQADGRKTEGKPVYEGTRRPSPTAPEGTRVPYDPAPQFQLPVRKTQDQLVAENRGHQRQYDVDLEPPIPVTYQPAEKTSSVPGESVWAKLLADHHVSLTEAREDSSSRRSSRQRFYQSVVTLDRGVKQYWQRYLNGGPGLAELLAGLVADADRAERNAHGYARSLERADRRRRAEEIKKFARECGKLRAGMEQAGDRR